MPKILVLDLPKILVLAAVGLFFCVVAADAYGAAFASSGTMPWSTPLQNIRDDLTGPTAVVFALLGVVVVFGILIFGGEINHFVRALCFVVLCASVLVGVNAFLSGLGIAVGGATVGGSPPSAPVFDFVDGLLVGAGITCWLWFTALWARRKWQLRSPGPVVAPDSKAI